MYHETSLSPPSPSDGNEGPCHGITDNQKGDAKSSTTVITFGKTGLVPKMWRKQCDKQYKEKVRKYVEKTDVAIALSKLNEGVKNIIKEYLNIIKEYLDDPQFDENNYKKYINKASNIVDNWEDGFPVRKNNTEADLKKALKLDCKGFLYLKNILPKGVLTILKYLTVKRMFDKEFNYEIDKYKKCDNNNLGNISYCRWR